MRTLTLFFDGESSLTLTGAELANSFNRKGLQHANVTVINEVGYLKEDIVDPIKQIAGRDKVSYTVKNVNGTFELNFQGILIISTNRPPEDLFRNQSALLDRVILINTATRKGIADSTLFSKLCKHKESLAYWFLTFPRSIEQSLVRTSELNRNLISKAMDVKSFIKDSFVYSTRDMVWRDEVFDKFLDFTGLDMKRITAVGALKEIEKECTYALNIDVTRVRKERPGVWCLTNLRWATPDDISKGIHIGGQFDGKEEDELPFSLGKPYDIEDQHPFKDLCKDWVSRVKLIFDNYNYKSSNFPVPKFDSLEPLTESSLDKASASAPASVMLSKDSVMQSKDSKLGKKELITEPQETLAASPMQSNASKLATNLGSGQRSPRAAEFAQFQKKRNPDLFPYSLVCGTTPFLVALKLRLISLQRLYLIVQRTLGLSSLKLAPARGKINKLMMPLVKKSLH